MLVIWTKTPASAVYDALSQVLAKHTDLTITVNNNTDTLPNLEGVTALFCLGGETVATLANLGIIPKNRSMTSLRGSVISLGDASCKAMVSYNPSISAVDYGWYVNLLCDAGSVIRLAKTGTITPTYGDYKYVPDFTNFIKEADALYESTGKPVPIALDLETLGLDPYCKPSLQHPGAYVVSIQVSHTVGKSDMFYFTSRNHEETVLKILDSTVRQQLSYILTNPNYKMVGANLKYDLNWLWVRAGLNCTNFTFDTTLVGSLLDENRSNGLDVHCKIYAPELGGYSDAFDATVDKSRMDLVPKDKLLLYAGGDSDATLRVHHAQKSLLLQDNALTGFYVNILHPASRAFEQIEQGGMFVDVDAYKELASDLDTEMLNLTKAARSIVGGRIWAKHSDADKVGGMNLGKASFINDFMFSPMGLNLKPKMFTEKSKAPSSAMEHLLMFKDVPEAQAFVSLLEEFGSAAKTQSTYVTGFLKHLRSDGKFHPSYYLHAAGKGGDGDGEGGTNTGRLSAKDPAFQTIPKHTKWAKPLRRCYIAPPGHVVVERDYSQGELKVVACIANERNMIKAYLEGKDLHALTGGGVAGYTYEQMMELKISNPDLYDLVRQSGKPANFGLLYGMGAEGFMIYAYNNYGVKLTLQQAEKIRFDFLNVLYPGLVTYHTKYKAFAHKHGFVRSPLGRIRHLPLINSVNSSVRSTAERQSINSPVQGTLSDMLIWTLSIEHKLGYTDDMPCFGDTHDAAYNYCPEDKVDIYVPRGMAVMENLPFEKVNWNPQLKFTADAKVGINMADLKKL